MTFEYILNERERKSFAEGAAKEKREIAKNMKEKNIPNTDIAEITGLSAEEIEKL